MTTARDIIDLWPTPAAFAEDLGLKSDVHARTMGQRGSIPRWYWPKLLNAARLRAINVDEPMLKAAHEGKKQLGVLPPVEPSAASLSKSEAA